MSASEAEASRLSEPLTSSLADAADTDATHMRFRELLEEGEGAVEPVPSLAMLVRFRIRVVARRDEKDPRPRDFSLAVLLLDA